MIPQRLIFCWPGDDDIPAAELANVATWRRLMPDWEQMLIHAGTVDMDFVSGGAFSRQTNVGAKSDILRVELLYQFGGLYLDLDIEPLASIADLLTADLVCAHTGGQALNAVMGCSAGHPAMRRLLESYTPLSDVTLGWSSVIQRTGSIAVRRALRGEAMWLDEVELAKRLAHRSRGRWKAGAVWDVLPSRNESLIEGTPEQHANALRQGGCCGPAK